jgi:hypothetical protein
MLMPSTWEIHRSNTRVGGFVQAWVALAGTPWAGGTSKAVELSTGIPGSGELDAALAHPGPTGNPIALPVE